MPSQTKRKRDRTISKARAEKTRKAKAANKARKTAATERLRTRAPTGKFTKFLELPGELRNAIYELVLEPDVTFKPATAHEVVESGEPERFALLAANRQIHDGAAAILARRATCHICLERHAVARPNRGQRAMVNEAVENFTNINISLSRPATAPRKGGIRGLEETIRGIVAVSATAYDSPQREVTLDLHEWIWSRLEDLFKLGGTLLVHENVNAEWKRCFQVMKGHTTIRWTVKVPVTGRQLGSFAELIKETCEKNGYGYVEARRSRREEAKLYLMDPEDINSP
ncbi:uncharacterized protein BDZ99DRAFT_483732 [Mytilinidion resinicola]|uniref:Uncharacterized protein n=1 Tax=Mytilinidion resinicola TaxID=574789 RepID=A0A6A6Y0G4_9PEZI|nr:uncharacterized protein BDZ99DRAFT_483732 [Mytilinidion resinicola]KAF2801504.1 hypothetical protein BDZ99DRAFT_483732 [Mytilinidion resinicola]